MSSSVLALPRSPQVSSTESAGERLQAWQHGLVTDSLPEWERRFQQVRAAACHSAMQCADHSGSKGTCGSRWGARSLVPGPAGVV